jgi:hypothetical protein
MFGLKAAIVVVALFASAALAQTGIAGKQDPAASFTRNLAAVSEMTLRPHSESPATCLSTRKHRRQPGLRTRCTLQKPQPAGPQ